MKIRDTQTARNRLKQKVSVFLYGLFEGVEKTATTHRMAYLKTRFQSIGTFVRIDPTVRIEGPKGLSIANNVHIGRDCHLRADGGLWIGENTHISRNVTIYSSDHRFRDAEALPYDNSRAWKPVAIHANVWIGINVCILPGVTIGEGAIIAMGSVIAKDVPPFAIVGPQPFRMLGERDSEHYREIQAERHFGGQDGRLLPLSTVSGYRPSGRSAPPDICFVASTGRSGSTTISDVLSADATIVARHEPRLQLVKLSTDYLHGEISESEITERLGEMILDRSHFDACKTYLESDQKYFNLIGPLCRILPEAKFIWLVRSGIDVVASGMGRSWFADPSHKNWDVVHWYFHTYRPRGDLAGAMSPEEWQAAGPFERNCWYWDFVNRRIRADLADLPKTRKMFMRLEDMSDRLSDLQTFLGTGHSALKSKESNTALHAKHHVAHWTEQERAIFSRRCGPLMAELYPEAHW
ncbi:Acetyltransferase (isoleucine patch superfamily) [Loktanella atrilutea]|uniref:Acetyltransferase (Isoleucine patch superfamily) n=1 Tax=Loktanella atrilutea TaxID=366533 RepID=A0A1M5F302_LOKAT|nr:DapH/DapD/GlmU-related protein [Loktanella atrilutea]SHF85970.1 Acetyltransferase (isoleucine patch superfamily) [Loktanella atrilutea]